MSQLRSLAERIHHAADDMPFTDARHPVSDNLDELEDRVRDIAGLIVHVTSAAAFADRESGSPVGASDATRRRVAALTSAVGTLASALADLGAAVAHTGLLRQVTNLPRSPERARTRQATRSALDDQLNSARGHLHQAASQLLLDAQHLTPTPPHRAPAPAAASRFSQAVGRSSPRIR